MNSINKHKQIIAFIFFFSGILAIENTKAADSTYQKTADGIIIYPTSSASGPGIVQLKLIAPNIIRVISSPGRAITPFESLTVVAQHAPSFQWSVITPNANTVGISTGTISAIADLTTGAVNFQDANGKTILSERKLGGNIFKAAIFDGKPYWDITQTFDSDTDDAYYGLGQHQDDIFNYKNQQVRLFQNNTEVAVPFLISKKNYGILWDNYSLSEFGDIRPYKPINALRLFSKNGERGWFTASYINDKSHPDQVSFTRAESEIDYEYLNDTRMKLPHEFKIANGQITWEGSIASEFAGEHKLRFSYAGYLKVWVDGKLLLDRWRQAWNPGSAVLNLAMEKEKKVPVKIEWIPDGGESYISLKCLQPIATNDQNSFSFHSEAGKQKDYYFIAGNNMDEVISGYRKLTGKATIVPRWAMGFWQSRERYKTQEEILNTISEFRKRKIPIDNIVLDWSYWKQDSWGSQEFDAGRFSNPDSMIRVLHNQYQAHFMISVWPKFYEGIPAYKTFDEKGWLYKRNIANRQRDWIAQGYVSTFYDAFNADARKGFWDLLNAKLFSKGIDAWWMDASEPDILSNVDPEKRKELMTPTALGPAAEYLNAYPLQNAKGIYEGQRSTNPNQRVFLLTRSGFAGSQRYAAAIWSGDIASRWADMKTQISAGLNFSMSGVPYWTMDIGGFAVEHRFENAQGADLEEWREQMTRWYQFGAFCPLFRVHGQFPFREIFNTAPEDHPAYKSMLYYDKLRYKLMPYVYTLAGMTNHNDYTIMRGLAMDFAKDNNVTNIGDQFMFGPSLLVCPVYEYHATNRKVYLPSGQGWFDFNSGKYFEGGQTITADAPYERLPLFVKEGSIIPTGQDLQYTGEKPMDIITLYVYTGKDGSFTLYNDEGTNYNYENGSFSNIPFTYTEADRTLTIGKMQGSFKSMPSSYHINIVWVSKDKPGTMDNNSRPDISVTYKGQQMILRKK
ncbi:MAG: alpha-xylosidase [Bacteroidetes bacterium]|nr:MAG: alpha-xylosidase [Bacteroidota bacterium]